PYIKFSDLKTGNYGVVRNNWYVLSVGTIAGLATGVGDETETEPTVDPDPDKYMIDVVLRVLQWHMRNQTVDL
ncbi:MAG: fimbria major subunit, partial [Prevotellaceae bacterium]|nr:fimbria major subunit [Prevotellaceae bacterium]